MEYSLSSSRSTSKNRSSIYSSDSVFDVLNDDHTIYLDNSELELLIKERKTPHVDYDSDDIDHIDFSAILNDDHDFYLEPPELYQKPKPTPNLYLNLDFQQDYSELKIRSPEEHLKYLSFIQSEYEVRHNAALKIQRCWKRYYFRKVFFRIKTLLHKYNTTKPALVLRSVNPNEAMLFDRASGTFIKFKLAGVTFPPKIVYKIYSRHPVVKINSMLDIESEETCKKTDKSNKYANRKYEKKTDILCKIIKDKLEVHMNNNKKPDKEVCEKNDWRPYIFNKNLIQTKTEINKGVSSKTVRPKSKTARPKSNNTKRSEITWIKNRYGL